jgi:ribosomal protein S18 acetylase RimI-like enzyme
MSKPASPRYFRKLRRFERPLYLGHLLRLSADDRRYRFQGAVTDAGLALHAERVDFDRVVIIGCFEDGNLIGVGEAAFDAGPGGEQAEIAVSVDPGHQGQGLGGSLTRRALRIAQNRGAAVVWLYCLPENAPMRAIVRRLPGQLRTHDGRLDAMLRLRPPTLLTRIGEQVEEGMGLLHSVSSLVFAPAW